MSLVEIAEEDLELAESFDKGEDLASVVLRNNYEEFIDFLEKGGPKVDVNVTMKNGANLVHLAVGKNNLRIVKELVNRGADVHSIDDKCDTLLHVAAKFADVNMITFILRFKVEINFQNKIGDTPVHTAVREGNLPVVDVLCRESHCRPSIRNKDGETPLTLGVVQGKVDIVKCLLSHRVELNGEDKEGLTPLHHAIFRCQSTIALMLINAGAHVNRPDRDRNTPLHLATQQGLLPVVQALCAFGCKADCYNSDGLTALQVGARHGHIDVVRCLLLAGASPFLPSRDNVYPDIMAYARGHKRTGTLLHTMTPERRALCIEQLIPNNRPISKIKLKIFGSLMSGKTSLIETLRSGYIRGVLSSKLKSFELFGDNESNAICMNERGGNGEIRYEVGHEAYTRGIEVQSISVPGCGDFSVWEFSGYEPYYCMYDHFIGDITSLHMICISLTDPFDVMRKKLRFWLEFVGARITPREPLEHVGCGINGPVRDPTKQLLGTGAKVLVVATHCNVIGGEHNSFTGLLENSQVISMFHSVREGLQYPLDIHNQILFVDSADKNSAEIKNLRNLLGSFRSDIVAKLPPSNLLVDATAGKIHELIVSQDFPLVSWQQFVERIRAKVNPLCNEDHLKDLIQQLQYMGELIYLDTESEPDIIILSPNWLCSDVIGYLLSFDNISASRVTGSFTRDEVELMLGVHEPESFLRLLSSLDLCVEVPLGAEDDPTEVQYEMPSLNFVESPQLEWPEGQWIGLQIIMPSSHAVHVMPRIQAQLRRSVVEQGDSGPQATLDQWYHGSLLICFEPDISILLTLENGCNVIEIKGFCPNSKSASANANFNDTNESPAFILYGFFQDTFSVVLQTVHDMCGSLEYEVFAIGGLNSTTVTSRKFELYSQGEIARALLDLGQNSFSVLDSNLRYALYLNLEKAASQLTPGPSLHVSNLRAPALRRLCRLLDPPDPSGRDWCLLGLQLGLDKVVVSRLETATSPTGAILTAWVAHSGPRASIQKLINACEAVERKDAALMLTASIPLYQYAPGSSRADSQNELSITPDILIAS